MVEVSVDRSWCWDEVGVDWPCDVGGTVVDCACDGSGFADTRGWGEAADDWKHGSGEAVVDCACDGSGFVGSASDGDVVVVNCASGGHGSRDGGVSPSSCPVKSIGNKSQKSVYSFHVVSHYIPKRLQLLDYGAVHACRNIHIYIC